MIIAIYIALLQTCKIVFFLGAVYFLFFIAPYAGLSKIFVSNFGRLPYLISATPGLNHPGGFPYRIVVAATCPIHVYNIK